MDPLGPIDANRMRHVDPDQWMKDMDSKIADYTAKSVALAENLATATATVTSSDGAVTVTIAPTGALQNIELTPRAAGRNPAQLTASIMDAVRKGQRAASEKMVEAFAPLGAGTESMDLVLSYLPPAEEEEDTEPEDRYGVPEEEPTPPPVEPPRVVRPQPVHEDDDNEPW